MHDVTAYAGSMWICGAAPITRFSLGGPLHSRGRGRASGPRSVDMAGGQGVSSRLSSNLGQAVVVDNRPGAGGAVGAEFVVKSAPDGDTLLLTTAAIYAILPNLRKNLPYDPVSNSAPITRIAKPRTCWS